MWSATQWAHAWCICLIIHGKTISNYRRSIHTDEFLGDREQNFRMFNRNQEYFWKIFRTQTASNRPVGVGRKIRKNLTTYSTIVRFLAWKWHLHSSIVVNSERGVQKDGEFVQRRDHGSETIFTRLVWVRNFRKVVKVPLRGSSLLKNINYNTRGQNSRLGNGGL